MGIIRTVFEFSNPSQPRLQPVQADALIDAGAVHRCLPEHLAIQWDLRELEKREVTLANGQRASVPYSGPVEIRFKKRRGFTGAMIMGDAPLMGAIPLEDMDLVVIPTRQSVDVNPAGPNMPMSLAK